MNCLHQDECQSNFIGKSCEELILNKKCVLVEKNRLKPSSIYCPRCVRTHAKIPGICSNKDCEFYTSKLSFNCFILHQNLFYESESYPSEEVLKIATQLTPRSFNRFLVLGIFSLRISTILVKYVSEYLKNIQIPFYTKDIQKIIQISKFEDICGICGNPIPNSKLECNCISSKELRKKRIKFWKKWKSVVENTKYDCDDSILDSKPKEILDFFGEEIYSLKFVRFLLKNINIDGVKITDIPFGFVFNAYRSLFTESTWKSSENLGIPDALYEKCFQLFNVK